MKNPGRTPAEKKAIRAAKNLFNAPKGKTKSEEKKRTDKFVEESLKFLLG